MQEHHKVVGAHPKTVHWPGRLHNSLSIQENSVKPFRLVKYISVGSFLVIMAATLLLSLFFFERDRTLLLRRSEEFAVLLAENLNNQVFQKFVMPTALLYGKMSLRDPKQYNQLDTVVRTTIFGFNVEEVDIYSLDDLMVYSTEYSIEEMLEKSRWETPLGLSVTPTEEHNKALAGAPASRLIATGSIARLFYPGDHKAVRVLSTYSPFRVDLNPETKTEEVIGVLNISQDITQSYKAIIKNQALSITIFASVMTFLFVSLLVIARRAETIIHRRAEEKKRLEEKLNHAERLAGLGQMVAGVSHEIRSPLGVIRSTAELLVQRIEKYEPGNRLGQVIIEESNRLDRIVTEFLDFARPQVPNPVPSRLNEIILRNLEALTPELERLHIKVDRSGLSALDPVYVDADLIYRSLLNVFNNAVQAMPDGGTLRVSLSNGLRNNAPVQVIRVEDTGDGIPPEVRNNIFQPFFTTRETGTGLGLPIVKNILESHGGWIEIESPAESDLNPTHDRGTRVSLYLRVRPDHLV